MFVSSRPGAAMSEPAGRSPEPSSARNLADLARAGYQILRQPFTHVDFEVHHAADRPGYVRDNVFTRSDSVPPDNGDGSAPIAVEGVVSAANGVALVIGTTGGTDPADTRRARQGGGPAAKVLADEPGRRVFQGTALPNPTFLFESALTYEGIVSVEPSPISVKFYQSLMLRNLILEISRIAADVAKAPLLYLQSPAQLPALTYIGQDVKSFRIRATRRSSSLAVRFAIALQHPSARLRFELTDVLRRYCTERGFGLWLADTRIGYRSGNWFQISSYADEMSRRERQDHAASVDSHTVEACLPVTFIGPARIGSTHRVVSFLSQFANVGIISCSVTGLDDLAFIHLQLAAKDVRRSTVRALNAQLEGAHTWESKPTEALELIHKVLDPENQDPLDYHYSSELTDQAGDYQTLIGPMLGCKTPDKTKHIAVWFSWQVEGTGQDLAAPLTELFGCFSSIGLGPNDAAAADMESMTIPNLEYLVCRDIGDSVVRGRGKLSIPEDDINRIFGGGDGIESAAVRLCVSMEDAWKASLRHHGARGVSEVTVAWREWWLGHWASPV
jgi:hypothetical protein